MRLRLVKVPDWFQFLTCLKQGIWGSMTNKFNQWEQGDYVGFLVGKSVVGLAEVTSKTFKSEEVVWDDDIYLYRIHIKFLSAMTEEHKVPLFGELQETIIEVANTPGWGWITRNLDTDRRQAGRNHI